VTEDDLEVRPAPDFAHRWLADVRADWSIADHPNGGYLAALTLRALAAESPHPDLVATTIHYLRPTEIGPMVIDTRPVRTGRRIALLEASAGQGGVERYRVSATFAAAAAPRQPGLPGQPGQPEKQRAPSVLEPIAPSLPSPSDCVAVPASLPGVPGPALVRERVEVRVAPGTGWLRGQPSGVPVLTGWARFADGRATDRIGLALLADAFPPAVLEITSAEWVPTVTLTVYLRGDPAPGWVLGRFSTRLLRDGWLEEDGELFDSTRRLVAQSRQLALLLPSSEPPPEGPPASPDPPAPPDRSPEG
jgi:acyl-CoA thioesterase